MRFDSGRTRHPDECLARFVRSLDNAALFDLPGGSARARCGDFGLSLMVPNMHESTTPDQ